MQGLDLLPPLVALLVVFCFIKCLDTYNCGEKGIWRLLAVLPASFISMYNGNYQFWWKPGYSATSTRRCCADTVHATRSNLQPVIFMDWVWSQKEVYIYMAVLLLAVLRGSSSSIKREAEIILNLVMCYVETQGYTADSDSGYATVAVVSAWCSCSCSI